MPDHADPRLLALDALLELVAEKSLPASGAGPHPRRRSRPLSSRSRAFAAALDVSTATVDRLVKEGRIPFFLVGDVRRFDVEEVREALRVRKAEPIEEAEPQTPVLVRYGRRRGA